MVVEATPSPRSRLGLCPGTHCPTHALWIFQSICLGFRRLLLLLCVRLLLLLLLVGAGGSPLWWSHVEPTLGANGARSCYKSPWSANSGRRTVRNATSLLLDDVWPHGWRDFLKIPRMVSPKSVWLAWYVSLIFPPFCLGKCPNLGDASPGNSAVQVVAKQCDKAKGEDATNNALSAIP